MKRPGAASKSPSSTNQPHYRSTFNIYLLCSAHLSNRHNNVNLISDFQPVQQVPGLIARLVMRVILLAGVVADTAVLLVIVLGVLSTVRDTLPTVPNFPGWAIALLGVGIKDLGRVVANAAVLLLAV